MLTPEQRDSTSNQTRRDSDIKKMKNDPTMLEEYDFSGGVRGKFAKR
jgi:hypothetical protein